MKVLYITKIDIFGEREFGGKVFARKWYDMLEELFGKENIYVYIIAQVRHKSTKHIRYFYNSHENNALKRNIDFLFLRDGNSKKIENRIVEGIKSLKVNMIFFDGTTFGRIIKRIPRDLKTVALAQNLERQYIWNLLICKSPLCIFHYVSTCYNEKQVVEKVDRLVCLNKRDSRLFTKVYHRQADLIVPITFKDNYSEDAYKKYASEEEHLAFIGSNFIPNNKGIKWFVKHVQPKLDYQLDIIGFGMEELRKDFVGKNVNVIGSVDDLAPYYYNAEAIVMPIFIGSGMKVKTAEALMYGKTIFATKEALEGYDVKGIKNIYECNTEEEFVEAIKKYMKRLDRKKMNEETRRLFLEKYENTAVEKEVWRMIKSV